MESLIKNGINYGALCAVKVGDVLACVSPARAQYLGLEVVDITVSDIDFDEHLTVRLSKGHYTDIWLYTERRNVRKLFNALLDKYKDHTLTVSGAARHFLRRTESGEVVEKKFNDFYLVESEQDKLEAAKYDF